MLEGLRSDFRVFNEGLADVREQVKELRQETKELRRDIKEIRQDMEKLNKKIDIVHIQLMDSSDDIKQILNNHEERIANLETCKK